MPISRKLISELQQQLQANAIASHAKQMQAYMKSAMPFYGIKVTPLRHIAKTVFEKYPLPNFENWRDTVLALWRGAKFREERHCAIELTGFKFYKSFQTLDALPLYEEIIVTGAWWDYVDTIAAHRIGTLLEQYPQPMKTTLKQWARGEDMWLRRTAILSQLRFKQNTDLTFLYQCIQPSLGSKEFFLQKAIGWALRQYARTDMREVVRYVNTHRERLSKLSVREALKHHKNSR